MTQLGFLSLHPEVLSAITMGSLATHTSTNNHDATRRVLSQFPQRGLPLRRCFQRTDVPGSDLYRIETAQWTILLVAVVLAHNGTSKLHKTGRCDRTEGAAMTGRS